MYYIVLPKSRAYYRTCDNFRVDTKDRTKADRYSQESAERIAKQVGGVAVDERTGSARSGIAAVELALLLPLFCLLVLGMLEYGRVLQCQQKITNVSFGIARYAADSLHTQAEIDTYVGKALEDSGIRNVKVVVSPDRPLSGEPITARVSVASQDFSWLPPMLFKGELTASSTLRRE